MPGGEYKLGSHTVTKCLGGVRLADGTLAGSTLTMDQALRNLVKIGLPISEASQRLSHDQVRALSRLGETERHLPADLERRLQHGHHRHRQRRHRNPQRFA